MITETLNLVMLPLVPKDVLLEVHDRIKMLRLLQEFKPADEIDVGLAVGENLLVVFLHAFHQDG